MTEKTDKSVSATGKVKDDGKEQAKIDHWIVVAARPYSLEIRDSIYGGAEKSTCRIDLSIGPNIICSNLSVWALLEVNLSAPPPRAVASSLLRRVELRCTSRALDDLPFEDSQRNRDFAKLTEAHIKALELAGWKNATSNDWTSKLFRVAKGNTCPAIAVCKVDELTAGESEAGRHARMILDSAIDSVKGESMHHLGALHDLMVMSGAGGRSIALAARKRAHAVGIKSKV
jgi:hypothetical protein